MRTVHEVSGLTGVSVRTLHYYDAIGLLKPTQVTGTGYRLYDDAALERLQDILLFRELQFPLREIKAILESPHFDREKALQQQIGLLRLQQKRLGELIAFACGILSEGVKPMDFSAFDKTEIERYAAEAKSRWGQTEAFQEYERRAQNQPDSHESSKKFMELFAEIGKIKHLAPGSEEAQAAVEKLRQFITEHYYTCTPQILRGLGGMYTEDSRMKRNIDHAGGIGTAAFARAAIEVYCGKI